MADATMNPDALITNDTQQLYRTTGQYSSAEKAYTQFNQAHTTSVNAEILQMEDARRNARQQEADANQARTQAQELFHVRTMNQQTQNFIFNLAALNAMNAGELSYEDLVAMVSNSQSGSQVSINDLIAAIGQQMAKNASNTPPQTGN